MSAARAVDGLNEPPGGVLAKQRIEVKTRDNSEAKVKINYKRTVKLTHPAGFRLVVLHLLGLGSAQNH